MMALIQRHLFFFFFFCYFIFTFRYNFLIAIWDFIRGGYLTEIRCQQAFVLVVHVFCFFLFSFLFIH